MSKHTKTPWHTGGNGTVIYDAKGAPVASATTYFMGADQQVQRDNARRIVACANACHGIATEALEQFTECHKLINGYGLFRDSALEAERDALLAAINKIDSFIADAPYDMGLQDCAKGAIAKARALTNQQQ